jgi:hypothetical protein
MALSKNIHFEVQGLKGSSWTILKVLRDEARAMKEAQEKWGNGVFKAIKVTRERLNPDDGTYFSSEIFFKGKEAKSKNDADNKAGGCWKASDLGSFEGRRTIAALLAKDLETWQITPMELTHSLKHYYELDNTGVLLQNAVQRAAIEQIKGTKISVQDRMKDLYALIEQAVDQHKEHVKKGDIPDLSKTGFEDAFKAVESRDDKANLITLAIVGAFEDIETIPEKMAQILKWLKPDHPTWVLFACDGLIAELFGSASMVKSILGGQNSLAAALTSLAHLTRGSLASTEPANTISSLNEFMKSETLRQTRLSIFARLRKELTHYRPLADGEVVKELRAVSNILKALRGPKDERVPDIKLMDAIDERCAKNLSQQAMGEYLADVKDPIKQIKMMLEIAPHLQGETSNRKLANYFMPILNDPQHELLFRGCDGDYLERMFMLSDLQRRILGSRLGEDYKQKLAEHLDMNCANIVTESKVLLRLSKQAGNPIAAGKKLLKMIAEGYFTVGNAGKMARHDARRYMREPNFIEKCIEGDTDAERAKSVMSLQKLMVKAGMTGDEESDQSTRAVRFT